MRRSCARLSWAMVPTWADGWTVMSRWKAALYTSAAPRCWAFFIRRRNSAGSLHLSMLSRMRVRFGVVMSSASLSGVASTVSSTRARPGSAPWDWRCDMDCPVSRGVEPTLVSPAAKFVLQGLSERSCRGQSEPETRLPGGSEFRGASSCLAENPHSCTKSATNRHTFGEVSATEPAAPTPLKGARHQTGPHSRLPDTEVRSRLRVPDPRGRSPQAMAALRQRGVFDVVRPHACAVAQADRCGAGWRPVSTMRRCAQTHRRRGSAPGRDRDAQGC